MGSKRSRLEFVDPNKSDSDDENFEPSHDRPRKTPRRSKPQKTSRKSTASKRRKDRYAGSDVEEDDDVSDSLLEEDFYDQDNDEDDEEPEIDEKTGRAKRKAAKAKVNYEEPDSDEIEEPELQPVKPVKPRHIVKLKYSQGGTRQQPARSTRNNRGSVSVEPTTAAKRVTRAGSTSAEPLVALTSSGRHAEPVRASKTPEATGRETRRATKSVKRITSAIVEESQEEDAEGQKAILASEMTLVHESVEDMGAPKPDATREDDAMEEDELAAATVSAAPVPDAGVDEDEEDEGPINRRRVRKSSKNIPVVQDEEDAHGEVDEEVQAEAQAEAAKPGGRSLRTRNQTMNQNNKGKSQDVSSDFEPQESQDEAMSDSDGSPSKRTAGDGEESSTGARARRSIRGKSRGSRAPRRSAVDSGDDDEPDPEECGDELEDLTQTGGRRSRPQRGTPTATERGVRATRNVKNPNYKQPTLEELLEMQRQDEEAEYEQATPSRTSRARKNALAHTFHTTYGPFGGGDGLGQIPITGGLWGTGATGGISDSSDDENMQRPGVGGTVGMTPTSAVAPGILPTLTAGTPNAHGRVKSQKALTDADPLGVDQNVDFSKVGGLDNYIEQLKEMVQMPLLYPELFQKFGVTPPRGVLFHGPPGTGKTLMARALAAQATQGGKKIAFFMRKGADALSKWVGEAERGLRLLFEEARKNQPSIIFFDEIDGLAPVRSSKQDQIHASIVSTLLALMDGMDGRGQVIIIGATNRPDNIDPALRRPGRFDREFYFPLPDKDARRSIIDIHTKNWGIDDNFKTQLAEVTKGYGGADLRSLCTEASLFAMQRCYPQVYESKEKLLVDPNKVKVSAKDFMRAADKVVPSSERSASSGAAPLPKSIEPLLRDQVREITRHLDEIMPKKKKETALQAARFEDDEDDDGGFAKEQMRRDFENTQVNRPRFLIGGEPEMGQSHIGPAILHHFEGFFVQSFDLPTIYGDSSSSPEATIVRLFSEVKRNKPSVIYLPAVEIWYSTLTREAITTFLGLLGSLSTTDPVLVLGISNNELKDVKPEILALFSKSRRYRYLLERPNKEQRLEYFMNVVSYVRKGPKDFPDPVNRKKRKPEQLELAPPPPPPPPPSKEEIRAQRKADHLFLQQFKVLCHPCMEQIKIKYKRFQRPAIPLDKLQYLLPEGSQAPGPRKYELAIDKGGRPVFRDTESGKFIYNLDIGVIEERLAFGYYARAKDFLFDIETIAKDQKRLGNREAYLKANELVANAEVDLAGVELHPTMADAENVYQRQLQRAREREEFYRKEQARRPDLPPLQDHQLSIAFQNTPPTRPPPGPVVVGEILPHANAAGLATPASISNLLALGRGPGHQHMSNGSPVPPRRADGGDVVMSGTEPAQNTQSAQGMGPPDQLLSRMGRGTDARMIQRSAFQQIANDISPASLINDASTTTSGKKTDSLNRSSQLWSTQATNGKSDASPTFNAGYQSVADVEIPDTMKESQFLNGERASQEQPSSQEPWNLSSQLPAPSSQPRSSGDGQPSPKRQKVSHLPQQTSNPAGLRNILNDTPERVVTERPAEEEEPSSSLVSSQKDLLTYEEEQHLLDELVNKTSGLSVEQMEQVNSELMKLVWELRGEYNRNRVAACLMTKFNECIEDVVQLQKVLKASQEEQASQEQQHALADAWRSMRGSERRYS